MADSKTSQSAPARALIDIGEQVPSMTDAQLKIMKENVIRLQTTGSDKQKNEAARLLPLIEAEMAGRKPPVVEKAKRAPAKPKVAKAKAAAK